MSAEQANVIGPCTQSADVAQETIKVLARSITKSYLVVVRAENLCSPRGPLNSQRPLNALLQMSGIVRVQFVVQKWLTIGFQ